MKRSKTKGIIGWLSLILVFLTVACNNERTETTGVATVSPTPVMSPTPMMSPSPTMGQMVRVADITGNLNNYVGKTVTVVAEVEEVRGPRAFRLDEDAPLAGGIDNDLWVLGAQATNLGNIDDQWRNNKVRVTGVVHRFVLAEIERELGWDVEAKLEVELERKKAVLVATSVERVQ
jgi:hypothetical protein